MQTLSHLQSQIRSRRLRTLEENQALQKQPLQKHAKELESMRSEEEWDDSLQSKERVEAKLLSKYEATMRRERALAYSYSHQQNWKNSSRSISPMFMDPTNPFWGWSWLEQWMAARPWESHSLMEKEKNDHSSVKSSSRSITSAEISKAFARFQLNSEKRSPTASQNPGSPGSQSHSNPPKSAFVVVAKKLKKASPKGSWVMDDDTKSMTSVQSERVRRHSIAGSIVRDDESLASSPLVPSYMVPTKSVKAKSRIQSPLGTKNGTPMWSHRVCEGIGATSTMLRIIEEERQKQGAKNGNVAGSSTRKKCTKKQSKKTQNRTARRKERTVDKIEKNGSPRTTRPKREEPRKRLPDWIENWILRPKQRKSGQIDKYYVHKVKKITCRSRKDVERYEKYRILPRQKNKNTSQRKRKREE